MRTRRTPVVPLGAALLLPALMFAGCAATRPPHGAPEVGSGVMTKAAQAQVSPAEALARLREGNGRYIAGTMRHRDLRAQVRDTGSGQYPFASVLGCIDSRVPPEVVFDQGLGDIFSARVAGNFVDPALLGSLEFASKVAGSKLILVLGHTECGAIKGACDDVRLGNLTTTLSYIRPAVAAVHDVTGPRSSKNAEFVAAVARMNIRLTMAAIREQSPLLDGMIASGEIGLAGAVYDVRTGAVEFLE